MGNGRHINALLLLVNLVEETPIPDPITPRFRGPPSQFLHVQSNMGLFPKLRVNIGMKFLPYRFANGQIEALKVGHILPSFEDLIPAVSQPDGPASSGHPWSQTEDGERALDLPEWRSSPTHPQTGIPAGV